MPLYKYKAIDDDGKSVTGSLDAANISDLEIRLEKMNLNLLTYKQKEAGADPFGRFKVERRDLINFSFHLEQLSRSGVPILEGLADLREGEENPSFRDVIAGVIEAIEGGKSFSEALILYPTVFDLVFTNLIKVGEKSGQMSEVLSDITETLKWQDEILAKAKKVMTYPLIIGVLVFAVIMGMMIFVVPDIMDAIVSLGGNIPFETRALMATSRFITDYWYVIIATPIILKLWLSHLHKTNSKIRYKIDDFMLKVVIVGEVNKKIKISRFTRYFALMFGSGITVLEAISLSKDVVSNAVLEDSIERAWQQISEGGTISESFQNTGIFPPLVIRMMRVGETGGRMDEALKNVTYFYERDINDAIDKMEPMMQTALMGVLGAIVMWLALSVLGPIYDTISTIEL